jgi:hypothetical protein
LSYRARLKSTEALMLTNSYTIISTAYSAMPASFVV